MPLRSSDFVPKEAPPIKETLVNIFPTNPVAAMAEGQHAQVIVFALLVGFALTRAGEAGQRLIAVPRCRSCCDENGGVLIELAPYGVFALLTSFLPPWDSVPFSIWQRTSLRCLVCS